MAFLNMHVEAYYLLQTQSENIQFVKVRGQCWSSEMVINCNWYKGERAAFGFAETDQYPSMGLPLLPAAFLPALSLKVLQKALFITVTCHTVLHIYPRLHCISKVVCDNGAYSCNTLVSNVKTCKCQTTFYVLCQSVMNWRLPMIIWQLIGLCPCVQLTNVSPRLRTRANVDE